MLLHLRGEAGWWRGLPRGEQRRQLNPPQIGLEPEDPQRAGGTTLREYAAYYSVSRKDPPWCSYFHLAGALFQEWLVVQWAKIEQEKLTWLRFNQAQSPYYRVFYLCLSFSLNFCLKQSPV